VKLSGVEAKGTKRNFFGVVSSCEAFDDARDELVMLCWREVMRLISFAFPSDIQSVRTLVSRAH
jgi:hypothetical protein